MKRRVPRSAILLLAVVGAVVLSSCPNVVRATAAVARASSQSGTPGVGAGVTGQVPTMASRSADVGAAPTASANGWAQGAIPSGLELLAGVACAPGGSSTCVAVGRSGSGVGAILRSLNGGAAWSRVTSLPTVDELFGASCADASHCWAVGQLDQAHNFAGVVLATNNSGADWQSQAVPPTSYGAYPWIRSITCVIAGGYRCWAVAPTSGSILATSDGGTTWTAQAFPGPSSGLGVFPEGISFSNASNGVFVGGDRCGGPTTTQCPGFTYRTVDGGASWQLTSENLPFLDDVSCVNTLTCWAVASTFSTGEVFASSDGGASWTKQTVPTFSGELNRIACVHDSVGGRCWAVGDNGARVNNFTPSRPVLLGGVDGGSCWSPEFLPSKAGPLYGVSTMSDADAIAVGQETTLSFARLWRTTSALGGPAKPIVDTVSPTGGAFNQKTTVTITGCGFTRTSKVFFGGVAAASVTYISPNQLRAQAKSSSLYAPGPKPVTVSTAAGSSAGGTQAPQFTYFIPEIGRLVFQSGSQHEECTGSVVNATNQSVVLTAGHCGGGGGTFNTDFAFAPGYYGPVCTGNLPSSASYLGCGTTPYGIWSARQVATNNQWLDNTDHALDYSFLVMNKNGSGQTIQQAISGGLVITFNPGRGQSWTTFGEPGDVLLHCTGTAANYNGGSPGPDMMTFNAPTCAVGGSSGGPWINGSNGALYGIGAVNSEASNGSIYGAYLGSEAQATFGAAETS